MGFLVVLFKPLIMTALNSCNTKRLVCELPDKYVSTTDNEIDDLLAASVRNALLKNCN